MVLVLAEDREPSFSRARRYKYYNLFRVILYKHQSDREMASL